MKKKIKRIAKLFFKSLIYFKCFYAYMLQNLRKKNVIGTGNKLSMQEMLLYFTPDWYHDFSCLGVKTFQSKEDGAREAQEDKQTIIFKQINKAVEYLNRKNNHSEITGVELFCADGFYSNYAVQNGVSKMEAIDLEGESGEGEKRSSVLSQGRFVSKLLGNVGKITYVKDNVFNIRKKYDLCLCLGGLYHINNPQDLLMHLKKYITGVLIIQTVVSLETEDEKYFETPCPGWSWGCRFSHNYLKRMVENAGWEIIEEDRNEITWNKLLRDRGSSYLLCVQK